VVTGRSSPGVFIILIIYLSRFCRLLFPYPAYF
jgi:hypothetical protein